jgi:hypothetical protein
MPALPASSGSPNRPCTVLQTAGLQAGGQIYSKRLLEHLDKNPYFVRVPAGSTFYLYVTQTHRFGQGHRGTFHLFRTRE